MTGADLELLLLTEQFEAPPARAPRQHLGETVGPGRRVRQVGLRPIDAGYVLSWREVSPAGRVSRRTGTVLAQGPPRDSVWVCPDRRRRGEGLAVLVYQVTATMCQDALRRVGTPADLLSTARWQTPRAQPRAVLRVDRVFMGTGGADDGEAMLVRRLHRPGCQKTDWSMFAERVELGDEVPVEGCYVVDGYLHPASARPVDPGQDRMMAGYIPVCPCCLSDKLPA